MKKISLLSILAAMGVMLSSCTSTYHFCQVYETKPVENDYRLKCENGALRFENQQCVVEYCFWANGGTADFTFHNKTDEIIYIDLSKSFYVMNGVAYDLYRGREWSQSSSVGVASSMSYSYGESRSAALSVGRIEPSLTTAGIVGARATKSASRSAGVNSGSAVAHTETSTVTTREKQIIAVPPHSQKYIKTYSITFSPMLSCDLPRYPSKSSRLDFTAESSPYRFSDIITYTVGTDTQPVTVSSEFYVSSVTNYAEPEMVVMKKREEPCENMRDPDYESPTKDLYDKVVRDNICEIATSFYNTYSTTTDKELYDNNWSKDYTYDNYYHAYVKSSSGGGKGIFGIVAVVGVVIVGSIIASGL